MMVVRRRIAMAPLVVGTVAALAWLAACFGPTGPRVKVENHTELVLRVHGELLPPEYVGPYWARPGGWATRPSTSGDLRPGQATTMTLIQVGPARDPRHVAVTAVTETGEVVFQRIYTAGKLRDPDLVIAISDDRPLPIPNQ